MATFGGVIVVISLILALVVLAFSEEGAKGRLLLAIGFLLIASAGVGLVVLSHISTVY